MLIQRAKVPVRLNKVLTDYCLESVIVVNHNTLCVSKWQKKKNQNYSHHSEMLNSKEEDRSIAMFQNSTFEPPRYTQLSFVN